jgi:ABC-2 type transport system ATP-binding protein
VSAEPLLVFEAVTRRWPGQAGTVLDAVDLELDSGEHLRVTAGNGAGKSTLLRLAAGLITPDEGEIVGLGGSVERSAFRVALGWSGPGDRGLDQRLSVRFALDHAAGLGGMGRRARREAVEEALEAWQLHRLAGQRIDRLSPGQRQRVRLASAVVHGPRILLLDEPQSSLDSEGVATLAGWIAGHVSGGGAVMAAEPTGMAPLAPADRELELRDAKLVAA